MSGRRGGKSRYWVPMVGHAFRILELFTGAEGALGLKEVSDLIGVSKSSAYRILSTLEELGYVERPGGKGKFWLGRKILEAAHRARARRSLVSIARPPMEELLRAFGETVNLAVLQGEEIAYVEILESREPFRMTGEVGARAPFHASAIGKAIAAYLPPRDLSALLAKERLRRFTPSTIVSREKLLRELARVRRRRYSVDDEEVERGATCYAVPLFEPGNVVRAALSVAGPTPRMRSKRKAILRELGRVTACLADSSRFPASS